MVIKLGNVDSEVAVIKSQTSSSVTSGTMSYLDAGGEQTVVEITGTDKSIIQSMLVDLTTMTQNGTVKVQSKIDGTNYVAFRQENYTAAGPNKGVLFAFNVGINTDIKITYTEGANEGADRAIPYRVFIDDKE